MICSMHATQRALPERVAVMVCEVRQGRVWMTCGMCQLNARDSRLIAGGASDVPS